MSGETGFLTRMFLRDCAFLMWLYGRSDSRWLWFYGVFAFSVTLGAFATLVFLLPLHSCQNSFPLRSIQQQRRKRCCGLKVSSSTLASAPGLIIGSVYFGTLSHRLQGAIARAAIGSSGA